MSIVNDLSGSTAGYGVTSVGNYGVTPTVGAVASGAYAPTSSTSSSNPFSGLLNSASSAAGNFLNSAATSAGTSLPNWFGASTSSPPTNPVAPSLTPGTLPPTVSALGVSNGNFVLGGLTIPITDLVIGVVLIGAIFFLVKKGKG